MAMSATNTARQRMTRARLHCGHSQTVPARDRHTWCTRCGGTTTVVRRRRP